MKTRIHGESVERFEALDLSALPKGMHHIVVALTDDAAGRSYDIPILVARGSAATPVFGITAAIHGDELNGIRVIQQLFETLDPALVRGTIVGCPILNLPGFLAQERDLSGHDLNRLMPGKESGTEAQVYAHRLMTRVIDRFTYLADLHTASVGRINSLYVRVNQTHAVAARMAQLIAPEIIVHNDTEDGTLRRAAMKLGIPSITVEVGNPMIFQSRKIDESVEGLRRVLVDLGFIPGPATPPSTIPVVCSSSSWVYADRGGLLEVPQQLAKHVAEGTVVGVVRSVFGLVIAEYRAPRASVVVGCSRNPVCETGGRIIHLGVVE